MLFLSLPTSSAGLCEHSILCSLTPTLSQAGRMSNWRNLFTQRGSDWKLSHSLLNNQITPNAAILEHLPTILHLPGPERFRWRLVVLRVEAVFEMKKTTQPHTGSTHQTVIEISTARTTQSIRIGFI